MRTEIKSTLLVACVMLWSAPVLAQDRPLQAELSIIQRAALRNWLMYGKQAGYTPLQACQDVGRTLPEDELEACVSTIGARSQRERQIALEAAQSKSQDEATAVREIVARAAAGDSGAMERCQWKVGGMQRELPAWEACRQQVRNAQPGSRQQLARSQQ